MKRKLLLEDENSRAESVAQTDDSSRFSANADITTESDDFTAPQQILGDSPMDFKRSKSSQQSHGSSWMQSLMSATTVITDVGFIIAKHWRTTKRAMSFTMTTRITRSIQITEFFLDC
jgi:hypothetical protein